MDHADGAEVPDQPSGRLRVEQLFLSFWHADSDYASGCGYVDINVVDFGDDVFAGKDFRQHLGVYNALQTVEGKGLKARILASADGDVFAVEIDDQRGDARADRRGLAHVAVCRSSTLPGQNFDLTTQHAVRVQTGATRPRRGSRFATAASSSCRSLSRATYYDASAVVIGTVGGKSKARYENEMTVRLTAAPAKGKTTFLIASAATFDPKEDVAALAVKALDAAAAKGFEGLLKSNQAWWHDFWSKAFVRLHSANGAADLVEQHYTYFLYIMGSCSRGAYPPRFGGMLWYTNGDMREWGSQYWWNNESCLL